MDDRKLRHDYLNCVQVLKSFVRLVSKGKLDLAEPDSLAIIEEAKRALEFLENDDLVERLDKRIANQRQMR